MDLEPSRKQRIEAELPTKPGAELTFRLRVQLNPVALIQTYIRGKKFIEIYKLLI